MYRYDYFWSFKNDKIEVPELLGLNYAEEVQGNSKYSDFHFDVEYVTSTTYSAGQISKQSPYGGAKAKKGSTIKLEVVSGGSLVEVPEIYGSELGTAKTKLNSAGFSNFNVITQYDPDADPGTVLKSEPTQGTKADTSSTITLYVATDVNENEVEVPSVVGLNYYDNPEDVEAFFTSLELELGKVEEEDSSEPKGYVLSQSIDEGEKAPKGTKINIVVSSGKAASSQVDVTFTLPNSNSTEKLEIFVANDLVESKNILCNGAKYTYTLSGTGAGKSVQIKLAGSTIYTATVDFTTSPATLTNVKQYQIPVKKSVPNVEGMDEATAKGTLASAGFTNVKVDQRVTADSDMVGKVIDVSPSSTALTTDTITIYIGKDIFG